MDQDIQKRLDELEKKIEELSKKRIYQMDITPGVIHARHFGQGNPYIIAGTEANRPRGTSVTSSVTEYFATDTNNLWIWNGTNWVSVTLA